jgi:hypothetical protein
MDRQNSEELTEGWPGEPDRAEMEAFARALAAGAPQLPDAALARVEDRVREEARRQRRRRRRDRLLLTGAAAALLTASVLILKPFWLHQQTPTVPGRAGGDDDGSPPAVVVNPPVRDTYRVPVLVTPAAPTPDKPLVALDAYQGLFSN